MSRAKGNVAEDKASLFLLENGYTILQRNFYSRFGEIDIIAYKDEVLHFVEVKSALDYELAVQNITKSKLSKLIRTGDVYLKKNALNVDYMYDAVIVTPENICHLQNITL
ncbi:MAG: YraN family protein [Sulfurimonas sp.]|jgi:putative endonuclease|uniref:YraN family protein n=1 Tax=Sulfurimonas sp. TaxID=2022749 RepID=UPI002619BC3A|nr:YraN family protein [Sulfurimonas sp.]MDD3475451.1 YraN family protein [Sulfurimonas sp.]HUH43207.1 YraN family protein [Sulfurimonas sp.]